MMLKELGNHFDRVSSYNYNTALIDLSSGSAVYYTYVDLDDNIEYFASGLSRLNLAENSRVAIISNNSFKFVVAYFAIRRAGLIPVLINVKLSYTQITDILHHSDAQYIIYEDEFINKIPTGFKTLSFNREYEYFLVKEKLTITNEDLERPAFFLYTSGTTGTPKGVVVSTQSRKWLVNSLKSKIPMRTMIAAPLYHMNGLSNLESRLSERSTIILHPKFNSSVILKSIINHKISIITAVPPMMAMILEDPEIQTHGYPMVRSIILASAPTSINLYDRIKEIFRFATVTIRYGLTEVGPSLFGSHPNLPTPNMSVGYPKPEISYKLVDEVLYVKSPSMLSSYHKDNERLTQNLDDDGYFNTKDKFKVDENGFYFFEGRADDMFVSGGENIYPLEIENLLESHSLVRSAAVIALEDDIKGTKPYAFVIKSNDALDEDTLKEYVLDNAPAYAHPRKIWFLDNFPLTGTNKIDKNQLIDTAKRLLHDE
jgi:acyl-CoA synthetase (AMP-forming)/AMP-acid ligase II